MRILVRLARLVTELRRCDDVRVVADLDRLPFYDGDVEAAGTPGAVRELRAAVIAADAIVVVTPEYNGTVPGVLGNAVDWLSRPARLSVLKGKPVLVLSASPGRFGAVRAADHLRAVLARIGADVWPTGLSIAAAHTRFGAAAEPALRAELAAVLDTALERTAAADAAAPTAA